MGDDVTVRPAEDDDAERISEVVESSMTTDYALSPDDIEAVVETEFAADAQRERFEDGETVALVAEVPAVDGGDPVLAGVVEATAADGEGAVRWLHVDPERRGGGVGSTLFERVREELGERGVDEVRAVALAANTSSGAFFERFGFEQIEERTADLGGREMVEYVFAETDEEGAGGGTDSAGGDESAEASDSADPSPVDVPETVSAGDGEEVYPGDDPFQGSEGPFVQTFADPDRTEEYGYYCLNCGSADVSMDSMERIRCENCGNTRKPDDDYDGSYL